MRRAFETGEPVLRWDAALYDSRHGFVAEYGRELLGYVPEDGGQIILDAGCGTGALTAELAKRAGRVIGADSSAEMIARAKSRHPELEFYVMDLCRLTWENYFDLIFSNAVFHWIRDQNLLLGNIFRALKGGGALVCEFGGRGNVAKIEGAFRQAAGKFGYSYESPFYFPEKEEYQELLAQNNLRIELILDFDRPTPLAGGALGLRDWMRQFFAGDLLRFSEAAQEKIFAETEAALAPELWDGERWIADYRRIRVVASK